MGWAVFRPPPSVPRLPSPAFHLTAFRPRLPYQPPVSPFRMSLTSVCPLLSLLLPVAPPSITSQRNLPPFSSYHPSLPTSYHPSLPIPPLSSVPNVPSLPSICTNTNTVQTPNSCGLVAAQALEEGRGHIEMVRGQQTPSCSSSKDLKHG
jgi:hypothetical protein